MKRFFKLIPAAFALVALASCSNDDLFEKSGSKAVDGKTMQATIEDYSNMTRAAFAENKTDDKVDARALVWTAGDSYKVYGELATADKYTIQNSSVGKKSGTFDCMTEDYNTEPAFAVFPYDKVEANRASSILTVTLSDWTYGTAEVKEDGYSEGGFVSNVPMYGKCDEDGDAAFGYMTGILRVDLSALPKKMTRLIVVTDRPLTGTFETEFDPTAATAEIASPVENDEVLEKYTLGAYDYTAGDGYYFLEVGTESVAKRTNKTFFIAVPTGNKYKVFDILIEYNMGNSKKYELVGQLGNTARGLAGKSILNWQRGKIKSLTKEITVTASGNTPAAISQFLKDEWKSFPDGDEINITVETPSSKIVLDGSANDIFTVPAELKGKVVNIIATEYDNTGGKLKIIDEDPAPVASTALRKINFIVPTADGGTVEINAPETQIEFDGVSETETATYTDIMPVLVALGDLANEEPGLTVGENAKVTNSIIINGGSFLSEGKIASVNNKGDQDILIKNNVNNIYSNGKGAVTVEGQLEEDGSIVNTMGTIFPRGAGAITVKNVKVATITDDATKKPTGAITIENVEQVANVTVQNIEHNAPINISGVTADGIGTIDYYGLGAITVDDAVVGASSTGIWVNNDKNTSALTVTNLKVAKDQTTTQTLGTLYYRGEGNVVVSGVANNKGKYPTVNDINIKKTDASKHGAGGATFTDVIIGTTLNKQSSGALTITGVRDAFGDLTNYAGAITITGNATATPVNINSLTQQGAGKITLKDINALATLTINESNDLDYESTFITTVTLATGKTVNGYGHKNSGIHDAVTTGTFVPTTDTWDGTSASWQATDNLYTSASLAKLTATGVAPGAAIVQYLDLDMGTQTFGGINEATADATYTATAPAPKGCYAISNLKGTLFKNWATQTLGITNLKLNTVTAANAAIMANSKAAVTATGLTIEGVTLSATKNAGGIIGIAEAAVTLTSCTVKTITISSSEAGQGTDINLGGFIGQVNKSDADFLINGGLVDGATITGHYYMGGFIGQVVDAANVKIVDKAGVKADKTGSQVKNFTFNAVTKDDNWSTLKCGTIAPFIGGINKIGTTDGNILQIYGGFTEANFTRATCAACKWDKNFLSNESFKFIGTKDLKCNFIGYINVANNPKFTYLLKHVNGFEANPSMTIITKTDEGKTADAILDTDCNVYASGIY